METDFQTQKDTSASRVVVVDYGLGNLRSVVGAVERVGYPVTVSSSKDDIARATKIILPGVGAFGDGMSKLTERGLIDPLNRAVLEKKTPVLGICLGFQLFANESYEFGHHKGLGWVDGSVVRIEPSDKRLRVPHVGWDDLDQQDDRLFAGIPADGLFYFVHSFFMKCNQPENVKARCHYGVPMDVVFHRENIYGTQFHPEKSQLNGLVLLRNFLDA